MQSFYRWLPPGKNGSSAALLAESGDGLTAQPRDAAGRLSVRGKIDKWRRFYPRPAPPSPSRRLAASPARTAPRRLRDERRAVLSFIGFLLHRQPLYVLGVDEPAKASEKCYEAAQYYFSSSSCRSRRWRTTGVGQRVRGRTASRCRGHAFRRAPTTKRVAAGGPSARPRPLSRPSLLDDLRRNTCFVASRRVLREARLVTSRRFPAPLPLPPPPRA